MSEATSDRPLPARDEPSGEWELPTVLAAAWATIAVHGWTPTLAERRGHVSTRQRVAALLRAEMSASDLGPYLVQGERMAPVIIDRLRTGGSTPSRYQTALTNLLNSEVVPEHHLGLAVSAVVAFLRLERDNSTARPTSDDGAYLGEVGTRVVVSGTVLTARWVRGFTPDSSRRLLVFDTDSGVLRTTTAASWAADVRAGEHLALTGTVSKHQRAYGVAQTVIVRPRRLDTAAAGSTPDGDPPRHEVVHDAGPRRRFPHPSDANPPRLAPRLTP